MNKGLWLIMACAMACGDAPKSTADTATPIIEEPQAPDQPTAWEYDGATEPPVYDQDALEDALNATLRDVMTISGAPIVLGYTTLMSEADDGCPNWYSYDGSSYWAGTCSTGSGASFDGYVSAQSYVDYPLFGDDSAMTGMVINGQAILTSTDGNRLDISGYAYDTQGTTNDGATLAWTTGAVGAFEWDDTEVADTWLGGPLKPTMDAVALQFEFGGTTTIQYVQITGGIDGLDTAWKTTYLDQIRMVDEVSGFWECGIEPAGIINARSPDGHWYQVQFDVEESEDGTFDTPPGLCDSCGTVFQGGEAIGEACVDVSPLINWEDQPW